MKDFGEKIKELRENKGLTQLELGKVLNVRNTTISAWEKDIAEPPYDTLKKICVLYNVSADYLLGLEDDFGNKTYTAPVSDNRHHNVNVYNVTGNHNKF